MLWWWRGRVKRDCARPTPGHDRWRGAARRTLPSTTIIYLASCSSFVFSRACVTCGTFRQCPVPSCLRESSWASSGYTRVPKAGDDGRNVQLQKHYSTFNLRAILLVWDMDNRRSNSGCLRLVPHASGAKPSCWPRGLHYRLGVPRL